MDHLSGLNSSEHRVIRYTCICYGEFWFVFFSRFNANPYEFLLSHLLVFVYSKVNVPVLHGFKHLEGVMKKKWKKMIQNGAEARELRVSGCK